MLQEIFSVAGPVVGVKIVSERGIQQSGPNYGYEIQGAWPFFVPGS